jgi:phosphoserine aminotransferase
LIYLLGKIAEDLNTIGIETVRRQTEDKAKIIYKFIENSNSFNAFVKEDKHRSRTVIVADCVKPSSQIMAEVKKSGMIVGSGYGSLKDSQIRIANFPATSLKQIDALIAELKKLD